MTRRNASRQSWRYTTSLALVALACAMLLGGLSAWFLGAVAIAGLSVATATTFNFFAPGALVRLFAVGRTVSRYGERLLGHKAALDDQVIRRVHLFSGMAADPATRQAGWQFGDESRLADYLDDVEDIDYAPLRAGLPAMTLTSGVAACLVATAWVAPWALLPICLLLLVVLLCARRVEAAGAAAWQQARQNRRDGARKLGAAMAAAVPLRAEGGWTAESAQILLAFDRAEQAVLSLRRLQSELDALAAAIGPVACLSVVAAAWLSGGRGETLLVPVFVAFAWLALAETMNGLSRIVVAGLRRRAAEAALATWSDVSPQGPGEAARYGAVAELHNAHLQRRAPDGRPIGRPLDLRIAAGAPTLLVGLSGSGKTSLLKQVAGWIGDDEFRLGTDVLGALDRRGMSAICLHDAAILDDTVRANLFGRQADSELRQALAAVELGDRVDLAGGLDGWIRQDMLSLGEAQRLNLARAWLSDRQIVLLDEPTEHLDDVQGLRILRRLLDHLSDRIVVVSSHRAIGLDLKTIAL